MKPFTKIFLAPALLLAFLAACDDDESTVLEITDEPSVIVINQGLMGGVSGTLDLLTLNDGVYTPSYKSLEGTPENIVECGGYIFVPQYERSAVAVFDKSSLRAVGSIAVPTPQSVCTDGNQVFAVGADSIFRINATSLEVEQKDTVGHTAYASVCANGSVYVAIGRGLGQEEGGNFLAKVNPATLQREYIVVGLNPYNQIATDDAGNVFVVCTGNYYDIPSAVYKVSSSGTATNVCPGTYIDVCDGVLYVVGRTSTFDDVWNERSSCTYQTYAASTGTLLSDDFLSSASERPVAATFVKVNPSGGDIYVGENGLTESGTVSYTSAGSVYRFDAGGEVIAKYAAGVNPYAMLFVNRRVANQ